MRLKYSDEDDRLYGAVGAVIGVCVYDGEKYIAAVNIDPDPEGALHWRHDFFAISNPGLSASSVWHRRAGNYRVLSAAAVGDVLCRGRVLRHTRLADEEWMELCRMLENEGKRECDLECDECRQILGECVRRLDEVFVDPRVHQAAIQLANALKRQRMMTRNEVLEQLRNLL